LYSGGKSSITITFDITVLGSLPTHAGIVWTDVGFADPANGFGGVTFSALDAFGTSLGSIGPFTLGDGRFAGETAEDRFLGIINPGGISAMTISINNSVDWEVDHLQYGFAGAQRPVDAHVPEPSSFALLTMASVILIRRFRKDLRHGNRRTAI
jgi:hypothetical protein